MSQPGPTTPLTPINDYDALIAAIDALGTNLGPLTAEKRAKIDAAVDRLASRNQPPPPTTSILLMGVGS